MGNLQDSTVPLIEVWIKPFQRFAGSQGSALSRIPQDAESPLETRGSARVSTKLSFQARPAGRKTLLRAKRAHEKRLKRFSHSGWRRTFAVLFPDQSGGLELPLLRGTKAKGWTTYGFPPFGNPFSLSVRYTFQPPTGWECTNSARRMRAVRRSRLSWHYAVAVYFMGQLRCSTGFQRFGRSVRQYDRLLRC